MPKRPTSSRAPWTSVTTLEVEPLPAGARLLIAALRAYRLLVSPALPPACRFAPTCSAFAIEAIHRHGVARGVRLALRRIARCHPWSPGGCDPVPPVSV
jgi:hypothetical protein